MYSAFFGAGGAFRSPLETMQALLVRSEYSVTRLNSHNTSVTAFERTFFRVGVQLRLALRSQRSGDLVLATGPRIAQRDCSCRSAAHLFVD